MAALLAADGWLRPARGAVLIWIGWRSARRPSAVAVLAGRGAYAIVTGLLRRSVAFDSAR